MSAPPTVEARALLALARDLHAETVRVPAPLGPTARALGLRSVHAGADLAVGGWELALDRSACREGGAIVVAGAGDGPDLARRALGLALTWHATTPLGPVLRRVPPARYRLPAGLSLRGRVLCCDRPFVAFALSARGAALLALVGDGSFTAAELAARAGHSLGPTATFLAALARRRLVRARAEPRAPHLPSVSCVVPALGRPGATRRAVRSLLEQDYPRDRYEVLVVDDGSAPPLDAALADLPVRVVRLPENGGPARARNEGVRLARHGVVAFLDNDCVASPAWLRTLTTELDQPRVAIAGGRARSAERPGLIARYERVGSPLDMSASRGVEDAGRPAEVGPRADPPYLPSCNLVVRRRTFMALGGFREGMRLGEDVDLVWRACAAGHRVRYAPAAEVTHEPRERLLPFLRRRAEYASTEGILARRFPADGRRDLHVPSACVCLMAAGALLVRSPALAGGGALLAAALLVAEAVDKTRRLRALGVPAPPRRLLGALLRSHGAACYHFSRAVGRYASVPLLGASVLEPTVAIFAALALPIAPVVDHRRKRPDLGLLAFLGLTALEMAAYQAGVVWGCVKHRTLRPLWPRVRLDP
ncbi:MAG: mycofactocin biosynthesis glycosyltransferase MftF [Sandaracinaceae bacterium]